MPAQSCLETQHITCVIPIRLVAECGKKGSPVVTSKLAAQIARCHRVREGAQPLGPVRACRQACNSQPAPSKQATIHQGRRHVSGTHNLRCSPGSGLSRISSWPQNNYSPYQLLEGPAGCCLTVRRATVVFCKVQHNGKLASKVSYRGPVVAFTVPSIPIVIRSCLQPELLRDVRAARS